MYRKCPKYNEGYLDNYLLFMCTVLCGLRMGEAIALRKSQFLFNQGMLVVDGFYKYEFRVRTNFNKCGSAENRRFKAIERVALRKLDMIQAAIKVDTLRIPPANHLEQLSGDREGQYSIRINDQWRICFLWEGTDAFDVEIVDYHKKELVLLQQIQNYV